MLVFTDAYTDPESDISEVLNIFDDIFNAIFLFEMLVKMIALGVVWSEDRNEGP